MMDNGVTYGKLARPAVGLALLSLLLGVLLAVLLLTPQMIQAQGGGEGDPVREVTDDEVNAISSELYCPVCENVPLDVCGTAACERWRAQVRTLLESGASEDEVVDYFVEQFGQRVVGTPQDPALSLFSWAVPVLGVVGGAAIAVGLFLRWRRRDDQHGDGSQDNRDTYDDEYRARLERELQELD